jgi:hypothetical protein
VNYVEQAFLNADIAVHVQEIDVRDVRDAIQRMAYNGVYGVVTLDYPLQQSGQVNIQVFERSMDGSVRFDEYLHISVPVATELINRVKYQQNRTYNPAIPVPTQPVPTVPDQMPHQMPVQQLANPAANLLGALQNMDPVSLQKVVSALQQQGALPGATPAYNPAATMQSILPTNAMPNPAYPNPLQQMQPAQDVNNILEQLHMLQGNK